jgi:hypothetical protein
VCDGGRGGERDQSEDDDEDFFHESITLSQLR